MAHDRQRTVAAVTAAASQSRSASCSTKPPGRWICESAAQHETPVTEIDDAVAERLAQDRLVLGDAEMVAVMVAAKMEARHGDRREGVRDLLLEPEIGRMVAVGDAVAEIDHGIGPGLRDEAAKLGHQRQRLRCRSW